MNRPSHKELTGKKAHAREAVSKNAIGIVKCGAVASQALELGYEISKIQDILGCILKEIVPENYSGARPPQKSYESQIKELELFAFTWSSRRFGCEVYFKFALSQGTLWVVSLHEHRE